MPFKRYRSIMVLCALVALPALSAAQNVACRSITNDQQRLACYDSMGGPAGAGAAPALAPDTIEKKEQPAALSTGEASKQHVLVSSLSERWDLDADSKRGTFVLLPYKPIYLLPFTYTDHVNQSPSSAAAGHTVSSPADLNAAEAKYQLSFKTKAAENIFGDNGDLWLGYTQSSHWQVYNSGLSRPFRETNYEPEALMVFRTNYELFGFKGTMASIGVNHQSNGRALPLSRSWNRVIAEAGFERGDWLVTVRPWWRLPESESSDDNPGIENYVGRGELMVARKWQNHVLSLQARHSLRSGENSRGSAQLAWSCPVAGDLKGYVQLFSGYGESMIDFNHRQTMIGAGITVHDWF
jgi:phospholipase A1/A2